MEKIKQISCDIKDELKDAKKYAKKALLYKDTDPSLAEMYYGLAREEMGHMERLHNMVVKIIKLYRDEHGDPPPAMQARYDFLHEEFTERAIHIQKYFDRYTGKT